MSKSTLIQYQENRVDLNTQKGLIVYYFSLKSWTIFDGSKEKDSANGTWVSLSTLE